jgi:2-keto-4-pentenoate hydratase
MDARLVSALSDQFAHWRSSLGAGAQRVGWKLGVGDRERIGEGPVAGHLTSATQLEPEGVYQAGEPVDLRADAEVALELAHDVDPGADRDSALAAIGGYGAALEIVDLGHPTDAAETVVARNVFHRAFALGGLDRSWPRAQVEGQLIVNGETQASAEATADIAELVLAVAALLGAMGARLEAGDRLITGSIVQIPIRPGAQVAADLGALGRVQLTIRS